MYKEGLGEGDSTRCTKRGGGRAIVHDIQRGVGRAIVHDVHQDRVTYHGYIFLSLLLLRI